MANEVFFTSDTHFGHTKTLEFRPFATTEEMDEVLIENWNGMVGKGDRVYHLGDFSFLNKERTAEIIGRLNGQIHMIKGNHDKSLDRLSSMFTSYQDYKTIKVDEQRIVLFHYAMRVWDQSHYGSWHLYAHSHGHLEPFGQSVDVGVDSPWITGAPSYTPFNYEEIMEFMSGQEPVYVDHHRPKGETEDGI